MSHMPLFYYCPWGWMRLDAVTSNAIALCNADAIEARAGPSISIGYNLDSAPAKYCVRMDWDGNVHQAWLHFPATGDSREVREFADAAAALHARRGYRFGRTNFE